MNMRFIKGMLVGGMVRAGLGMMYADTMGQGKKKMIKKGRQLARKMGMM